MNRPNWPNHLEKSILRDEIIRAVEYLKRCQRSDGSFMDNDERAFVVGCTGLTILALRQAGLAKSDPYIKNAVAFLRQQEPTATYELALQILALHSAGSKPDTGVIQRNVNVLESSQLTDGPARGAWAYSSRLRGLGGGDNSNSEFAIWALDAATRAGANVSAPTWQRNAEYWKLHQNADGGWAYSPTAKDRGSTGSMTCSGIASLSICLLHLRAAGFQPDEREGAAIENAVGWLEKNFDADRNPGNDRYFVYYSMVVRRTAELLNRDRFGNTDWRRDLAATLLERQDAAAGFWQEFDGSNSGKVVQTSMALIAVAGRQLVSGQN